MIRSSLRVMRGRRKLTLVSKKSLAVIKRFVGGMCWKCGETTSKFDLFCTAPICGVVQPIVFDETFDAFELFNLQPQFYVDLNVLEGRYRELQTKLHPDKFAIKTHEERDKSLQSSSVVNQSYQV